MQPYYEQDGITIYHGDCREVLDTLPDESVQMCVTSPPYYGLRDYGVDGQIGLESSVDDYVSELVTVFRDVRRVLKRNGTLWLNLGDSYAANRSYQVVDNKHINVGNDMSMHVPDGLKPKDLIGIPWRVAFALQADGWYLRQDIIWHKPNPMPESVRDRCTKAHEYIFLLSKSSKYFYDAAAVAEPAVLGNNGSRFDTGKTAQRTIRPVGIGERVDTETRNKRSVWTIAPRPYKGAHFAVFPPQLVEPCIMAGSAPGDVVLDPFAGSGTALMVAQQHGRDAIGIELNADYLPLIQDRTNQRTLPLGVA